MSLPDTITLAQSQLSAGHVAKTCTTVTTFIAEVQAQSGKKVTAATASQLIASAKQIQAVLGC